MPKSKIRNSDLKIRNSDLKIRNFPEFFFWYPEDLATLILMIHDTSSLLHCKYDQLHHKLNQNNDTQVQQNGIVNDRKRMKTATVTITVYGTPKNGDIIC
jgi:hypothetical protein